MNTPWTPGQPTTYYPEGAVIQHPSGPWYVRREGKWRLMTDAEIAAHQQKVEPE